MKISYFTCMVDSKGESVGAISKTSSFITGLQQNGHEVYLNGLYSEQLQISNKNLSGFYTKVRQKLKNNFSRYLHEPKQIFRNIRVYGKVKSILLEQKPDIIFERHAWNLILAAVFSKKMKIPLIVEVDAPNLYEYQNFYGRNNKHIPFIPKFTEAFTLKKADAIITISSVLKDYLIDEIAIPGEKIFVIPNGADPDKFFPKDRDETIVSKYSIKSSDVVIGWIGSLISWSGVEKLIAISKQLLRERKNIKFMFVGGLDKSVFLDHGLTEEEIDSCIMLPGVVPHADLNDFLSCMDIVLAPYPKLDFWWASSMKVFEYMGAGKAVIATGVGQLNTIITDTVNGLLLQTEESSEMIEKIKYLIEHKDVRVSMGRKAREDIIEKYSWKILAHRMAEVMEQVWSKYAR